MYDEWFNGLSEIEQNSELERQQKIKEKRKRDGEMALARLGELYNMMNEMTHGRICDYMEAVRLVNRMSVHPSKY